MTLNISQDLYVDLEHRIAGRPDYQLLLGLLEKPETPASLRIYSALRWFNAANESEIDPSRGLLNLAVAFETLLRLQAFSKTERLVDAISLLLGRTERLDDWAEQFYSARSRVAHEGDAGDQYFYIRGAEKRRLTDIFGSLMLFGRQVFRLCVGTLLVGIDLAERADLQEKFVSNNERYQKICDLLQGKVGAPSKRLLGLTPIMEALERYQFVASVNDTGPLLAAAQLAASALAACKQNLPEDLANAVAKCAASKREDGELRRLAAIEALNAVFEKMGLSGLTTEARQVRDLINLIWMNLFQRNYWLKDRDDPGARLP